MKGQASLETLILMGGLTAFFVSWLSLIGPLQDHVKNEALERLHQVAFERLVFAVRTAHRLGEGTVLEEPVFVPSQARLTLGKELVWRFSNQTFTNGAPARENALEIRGRGIFRVENHNGVLVSWR